MSVAHVGATVAPISRESVAEVFTVLEGLEVVATRTGGRAGRLPATLDASRRRLLRAMDAALDADAPQRWAELNTRFHLAISALDRDAHAAGDDCSGPSTIGIGCVAITSAASSSVAPERAQAEHHLMLDQMRARRPGRRSSRPSASTTRRAARCLRGVSRRTRRDASRGRRRAARVSDTRYARVAAFRDSGGVRASSRGIAASRCGSTRELAPPPRRRSPQPFRRWAQRRVGNRFCILPMEGWDGTTDGEPSDLTTRRWRNFGSSGAKLIWGGEAVAVRHDGRANPHQLMLTPETRPAIAHLRHELISAHIERFGAAAEGDLFIGLQLTHSGRFSKPEVHERPEPMAAVTNPSARSALRATRARVYRRRNQPLDR